MLLQLQIKRRFGEVDNISATTDAEPMTKCLRKYRDDYIGKRYGKLTVIAYPITKNGLRRGGAYCKCDCGEIVSVVSMSLLIDGTIHHCKECGRKVRSESAKKRWRENPPNIKRSKYSSCKNERLFTVWTSMKARCGHEKSYENIRVCDEWLDYFAFRNWVYSHGYDDKAPKGECTIDRINPFGNYEPNNCRFISIREQAKNKRSKWALLDEETRKALVETILASA